MGEMRNKDIGRHDPDAMYRRAGLPSPFPRGISHADLDCLTEIKHHYLVSEYKERGERLKRGQFYTLRSFWDTGHHCLIVWFHAGEVVGIHVWTDATASRAVFDGEYVDVPITPGTTADLHRIESAWARWADTHPAKTAAA